MTDDDNKELALKIIDYFSDDDGFCTCTSCGESMGCEVPGIVVHLTGIGLVDRPRGRRWRLDLPIDMSAVKGLQDDKKALMSFVSKLPKENR